jgi:hypothetical protein
MINQISKDNIIKYEFSIEKRDELIAGYKKRIASFMVDVRI